MVDSDFLVQFIKGLIYTSIYTYEFERALFWKRMLDRLMDGNSGIILEQHIIFRLATSTEVPSEMQEIGAHAINTLSIEHPDLFVNIKTLVDMLNNFIE